MDKFVKLVHNPESGEQLFSKKDLIKMVENQGFKCSYSSAKKKGWKDLEPETEFLIVAGGDGTIRKVAAELLDRKLMEKKIPLALLPLGTANNIAKTLGINGGEDKIVSAWKNGEVKKFDVGLVEGTSKPTFFLEGFGLGIFPKLMKAVKSEPGEIVHDSTEAHIQSILRLLHGLVLSYKGNYCEIEIDGIEHKGNFLLVEILNSCSIGPNLNLAPFADPGDGQFEIVLIGESQREDFAAYIKEKAEGREPAFIFRALKGRRIRLKWKGNEAHVDDKPIKLNKNDEVTIQVEEGALRFLVPAKG